VVAEGEQLRDKIGTPFYMAPEMLQSEPLYDPQQADVWSAGVVLFAMLFGFVPFFADTEEERMGCSSNSRLSRAVPPPTTWRWRSDYCKGASKARCARAGAMRARTRRA